MHAEYLKAVQRVGLSAEDAMEWLLKFIDPQNPEYDLEQLRPSESEKVKFEIAAIAEYGYQVGPFPEDFLISSEGSTKSSPGTTRHEPNLPTKKEVHQLQRDVRESVDNLINGEQSIACSLSPFHIIVGRLSNPLRGTFRISGNSTEMFMFKCYQLLAHFLPRLRHCRASDCSRLFLAKHGKKLYCAKQCQNRAGVQKFRQEMRNLKTKKNLSGHQKKGASYGTKRRKR